ncbi:hypothetical protein ACGFY7_23515 [Streptomyces prunicolor]|uniref:hypothetical protein n=1 Tax=Streptomyces prunicolor TaxID=67348 RepID=UPI0037122C33
MSKYEGMTNQDVDPIGEFAEIRDHEIQKHAEEEARQLEGEQDQIAEYGALPEDLDDDDEGDD